MPTKLKDIEYEIEEKEEKIRKLEKEIEELKNKKYQYIEDHCEYNKGEICSYDNTPRNKEGYNCSDCTVATSIWKVKE